jgi:hypothetical protein
MKKLIVMLFIAAFVSACTYKGEFREIQTDGLFTLSLPDYMKPSKKDLHESAILQYSNPYRNTYAIVIRDNKDMDFAEYQQASINVLKNFELLRNPLVTDSVFNENTNSYHLKLYGLMDEEMIYYWHNAYETPEFFYQLILWTRSSDRKQRYGQDIEKAIESFRTFK